MKINRTIAVINQMQAAGVIGRYAIGGAVGATFYLEPVRTVDVDVFVAIQPEAGRLIITPKPIYDYLTARGYAASGEYLMIEGWPVQFLPPTGPLLEEAIIQSYHFTRRQMSRKLEEFTKEENYAKQELVKQNSPLFRILLLMYFHH